jgi:hypothetical protein
MYSLQTEGRGIMNIPAFKALASHLHEYRKADSSLAMRTRIGTDGKYVQYSIIGVMADVFRRATKRGEWVDNEDTRFPSVFVLDGDRWSLDIQPAILEWYKVDRSFINDLLIEQMRGLSFEQLGKVIMRECERLKGKGQ